MNNNIIPSLSILTFPQPSFCPCKSSFSGRGTRCQSHSHSFFFTSFVERRSRVSFPFDSSITETTPQLDMDTLHRKQPPRQTLASAASRKKPGFRIQPPIAQEQPNQDPAIPSFGETLAPRVYAWSTGELDYRPRETDVEANSQSRISAQSPDADTHQAEFGPQTLVR